MTQENYIEKVLKEFDEKFDAEWWTGFGTTKEINAKGTEGIKSFFKQSLEEQGELVWKEKELVWKEENLVWKEEQKESLRKELVEEIEKKIKNLRWSNAEGRLDFELGLEKALQIINEKMK